MKSLLLFGFVLGCFAVPHSILLGEPQLPEGWMRSANPAPERVVGLIIALKESNFDKLEAIATNVSNPKSTSFGQHLSTEEIAQLVAPSADVLSTVASWLIDSQATFRLGATKDMFHVEFTVAQAEKVFRTTISSVYNNRTKQNALRFGDLHAPTAVVQHIKTIFGVHGLPLPPVGPIAKLGDPYSVTPSVIWNRYNVGGQPRGSGNTAAKSAVAEFQGQLMNSPDLKSFFSQFVPNARPGDDTVYKFVGPQSSGDGIEALLDIEYIMGVAPGVKTEFWNFPAMAFCQDLVNWTQAILNDAQAPKVFSVSYGWQGPLSQLGCAPADILTVDAEFVKLAAKGISIIFASGDSGSGQGGGSGNQLWPSWPASSPWVTAVGSTRFVNNVPGPEMATDQFGSGSGFSWDFPMPSWQKAAVAQYFSIEPAGKLPPANLYNRSGRATPDVAALGEGYQVVEAGSTIAVGGTSASAPAFAALVSLVNDARIAKGKSALGYLNQWIYQNSAIWQDVTVGTDRFGRGPFPLTYGFDCVKGWDPVSGWGTPNYQKMLASALALP